MFLLKLEFGFYFRIVRNNMLKFYKSDSDMGKIIKINRIKRIDMDSTLTTTLGTSLRTWLQPSHILLVYWTLIIKRKRSSTYSVCVLLSS